MGNYEDLNDREKCVDFPEEFIQELREAYHAGYENEALERAEEQGIDLLEIIA
ncbi:MAG TPA: hypothetical protein VNW29_03545 [Candidatus Sulfotelmatobacter sp.]|jgi:hypothetical protein|nr:hypothetical protein [Candidatus Sulfotelmatobacter sp.]